LLESLGVGADVQRLGYGVHSLRLVTPGGREMHLTTDHGAVVLLRKHFDQLLVEQARKLGADFRDGWKATELVYEDGRVVGVRSKDAVLRAEYVVCADGAHSMFAWDTRPKRTISTLMGWWEDFAFEPGKLEMIFDKNLSPLYGWMFPETARRVSIGICMDGEEDGRKTSRNVREVFERFLQDHFRERLVGARQVGKLKGHPISYTTWIKDCTGPGVLYLGEGARITHNATGEGIYQAMQSGVYAGEALADVLSGSRSEAEAFRRYTWRNRRRFTVGFAFGHLLRGVLKTPLLDLIAAGYNSPRVRKVATWAVGSALAGSHLEEAAVPDRRVEPSAAPEGGEAKCPFLHGMETSAP
jgi:flavin-dependent dehydrogenase